MFAGITFSRRGMFDKAETTEQTEESGSKSQKALARLGLQVNSAPKLEGRQRSRLELPPGISESNTKPEVKF